MIKSTRNYDMFTLRPDNREKIDPAHINRIAASIEMRNLLELRPIDVNSAMEIIDGQHRFLAAKSLGVAIFYQMNIKSDPRDIIILNTAKIWNLGDYLNYYIKNDFEEYKKLKEFMKLNSITLKIALAITIGQTHDSHHQFKAGNYTFDNMIEKDLLNTCWDTIEYIKRMNGFSQYTSSGRFWKAMLKLVQHHNFHALKWRKNLERFVQRFTAKPSCNDYLQLLMEVHNWKNELKVDIID